MARQVLQRLVPEAPKALRELIDPRCGALLPPLRAEIFGAQRFAQHGRSLGETHRAERKLARRSAFFPRLTDNIRMLRRAHAYIGDRAATGYDVSPAAAWLLDNFHLIEAQLQAIHEGLPSSYFRALPVLLDPPLRGLPRIYGVAWAFVAHTDGAFDEELLVEFITAYQQTRELSLSEAWALPTTLRVVLVENLRRLAERLATHKAARELAHLCCDRITSFTAPQLAELAAELARRGVAQVFAAQMAQRLLEGASGEVAPADVLQWLHEQLPEPAATHMQQNADRTSDNLSVSNAVNSLRAISDADWPEMVARSSALMRLMFGSTLFAAEHSTTRDQTLHGIEKLARRSGRSELAVAQALLLLMQPTAGPARPPTDVAAHWLQGPGRPLLGRALGLDEGPWRAGLASARVAVLPLYLSALVLGVTALVDSLLTHHAVGTWGWLAALLMLGPASEAVVAVFNRLVGESVRPHHLSRLALSEGLTPQQRVLVVMPAMLTSPSAIDALVHRLNLHRLANPERQAQFALLSDYADAATQQQPADAALLAHAVARVRELNATLPLESEAPRFIVLHRERRFSTSEGAWIGWERKRGKLEQLTHALATGDQSAFVAIEEASRLAADTQYVLTLDSDTQLPPGRLRELLSVAAHPQNQPRLDASGRRVVGGYGILQPRIATPLHAPGTGTPYHWLFAGQCGIDPYSAASSELYQDVFHEGSFTGKGLLHVATLHTLLNGRLPEGQVLSHDLLEGALVRCAAVSDITLVEDSPFHAEVAASRVHRWTRGDWQLLPLLLQPRRWPMRGVNRWKMVDNLRRSLVPPLALGLLLLALAGHGLTPGAALVLVLAAFAAGPLMGAVAGLAPSRDDVAKRHFYSAAGADLLRALGGGLWHLALLLQEAGAALDAIGRALWRMGVSRRLLLQWTTAAAAEAAASQGLRRTLRLHRSTVAAAVALWLALLAGGTPVPLLATALCALWAATPLWLWWGSRPRPAATEGALHAAGRAQLLGIARDTWRYFERTVTADDLHLPPDNLQLSPHEMLAHRTSPTNIGLYLLAAACARQFGWITTPELLARLEATLATLQRLPRHRGHFLNWYDTQTGAALLPMYVSTVDSGNLSGHLLATAQACRALAEDEANGDTARQLLRVARHFEQLAWEPDFGFLYHRRRRLLHIGWRVAEQQLDSGFYDLLASESRLTSLLAIAKGDVPVRHWAALGRPFFAVGVAAGLRSWSGSMFEYLMPTLVLDEPPGSVLHEAGLAALREQQTYARGHGVPWGISESAHAGCDHTLAYQYAPQGVPRLALRRTPVDELVVAPYATALAAMLAPQAALANFTTLQALHARGPFGYIEALDYTPSRQAVGPVTGTAHAPVDTFMAHHQGMSLVALANVLLDGVAQRWGMANPHIEAMVSLLHERAPREVSRLPMLPAPPLQPGERRRNTPAHRSVVPGRQAVEPTQLLSNGRYSVALRANGAGWSRRGLQDITRWRDDALRDVCGSFFFLRRRGETALPSLTQHPAPDAQAQYLATFHADRVSFEASWPDLHALTTVWVSPEDDIEFRQVELHHLGERPLDLELFSSFEPTLAEARADEAHPAFGNLFLGAAWHAAQQALMFERRPRLAGEAGLHMAHFLAAAAPTDGTVTVRAQSSRQHWQGRNRAAGQPVGTLDPATFTAPEDNADVPLATGLDPVCVLGVQLRLAPGQKLTLTFATAAAAQAEPLRALIDTYRQPMHVQRASLMSATLAGVRAQSQRLTADELAAVQTLSTLLLMTLTRKAAGRAGAGAGAGPQAIDRRLLWRLGLSGDRPLILVTTGPLEGLALVRTLAQALRGWAWAGVACDLVVVNAEPASYQMPLHREIGALHDRHLAAGGSASSFQLLRADELSAAELATLRTLARARFHADGRPLPLHVQALVEAHEAAASERHAVPGMSLPVTLAGREAPLPSRGHFDAASGEYRFDASAAQRPPRPWINVLANPGFGAQISEAGGGCTWAQNSRLNQLTAWSNDAVGDPASEWFLVQDLRTREVWSVNPGAWAGGADDRSAYRVAHGQGYTAVSHRRGEVEVTACWCVDAELAVKQVQLQVINRGRRPLALRLVAVAEWMLGAQRSDRGTVHCALHAPGPTLTALLATQQDASGGFGGGTAFLAAAGAHADWSCDRREAFDSAGQPRLPNAWGRAQGGGLDPCAALAIHLQVDSGETAEHTFLIGHARTPDAARALALQATLHAPAQRLEQARQRWDTLLDATTVQTPDPLFNALVNRWLLYQAVGCRLWAKAGFYQAGGATGFRDQLQDTLALAWAAPALLRAQLLLCASRQFEAGDVQHWWHAPGGAGVRTHFSDDLLWLPYALAHYLRSTADHALLDETAPFLENVSIPEGAEDAYAAPAIGTTTASVYEHAARAIDHSLRVGLHGLPLMGSGDWNDGMNRVGHQGRGESVWLAWFLCDVVAQFAPLAQARGEAERAARWLAAAAGWRAALLQPPVWDGQWFARAFFDDGQTLGSHANPEARIDLIAQAWAVLSGVAPAHLQAQALDSVQRELVDTEANLVRLLHPPLQHAVPSAGYIQAYPPGVRENGGQYSHGAVWALMAQARAGGPDAAARAWQTFTALSPAHRTADATQGPRYGLEPYVMAGDVYSAPPYTGWGGWSWYTGAAAWLHRAAVESLFGLQLTAHALLFTPCLPPHWPQAEMTLRRDGRTLRFVFVRRPKEGALDPVQVGAPGARLLAPGEALDWPALDGHHVFVVPFT